MSAPVPAFGIFDADANHRAMMISDLRIAAFCAGMDMEEYRRSHPEYARVVPPIVAPDPGSAAVDAAPHPNGDGVMAAIDARPSYAMDMAAAAANEGQVQEEEEEGKEEAEVRVPARTEYMNNIVRLMHRPDVVTDEQIAALPLPDGVDADEVEELRSRGKHIFNRLYCHYEDIGFNFFGSVVRMADRRVVDALDFMLKCDRPTLMTSQFLESVGAEKLVLANRFRDMIRSNQQWMNSFATVMNYVIGDDEGEIILEPADAVLTAWDVIMFDRRESAQVGLTRRRNRQLIKMRASKMFYGAPPEAGRPNDEDVLAYFNYRILFGTHREMTTLFEFDPVVTRAKLERHLRAVFQGWEPAVADEVYDEQKLIARQNEWERDMGNFERNVLNYLVHTLDNCSDRFKALRFLVHAYGGHKIDPLLVYRALEGEPDPDDDRAPLQFKHFMQTVWAPHVKPDRATIVNDATSVYLVLGQRAFDGFVLAVVSDLVNWPCEADTKFLGELMDITFKSETRGSLLRAFIEDKVPEGSQHMTPEQIDEFIAPLWSRIDIIDFPFDLSRIDIMRRYVLTWSTPITDSARHYLLEWCHPSNYHYGVIETAIELQREAARSLNRRKRAQLHAYGGTIKDKIAADAAPVDTCCVACLVNERRVCFVPCGHIVTCIECAPKCKQMCPMCRAPISIIQPCRIPGTDINRTAPLMPHTRRRRHSYS